MSRFGHRLAPKVPELRFTPQLNNNPESEESESPAEALLCLQQTQEGGSLFSVWRHLLWASDGAVCPAPGRHPPPRHDLLPSVQGRPGGSQGVPRGQAEA